MGVWITSKLKPMNANNFGAAILIAKVSKGQILYSRILRKRIKPNKTCLVFGKVVDISKMPKHLQ